MRVLISNTHKNSNNLKGMDDSLRTNGDVVQNLQVFYQQPVT